MIGALVAASKQVDSSMQNPGPCRVDGKLRAMPFIKDNNAACLGSFVACIFSLPLLQQDKDHCIQEPSRQAQKGGKKMKHEGQMTLRARSLGNWGTFKHASWLIEIIPIRPSCPMSSKQSRVVHGCTTRNGLPEGCCSKVQVRK